MKCVIVAGGTEPRKTDLLRALKSAEMVIAVDGAAMLFDRRGLTPHKIVGDMDTAGSGAVSRLAHRGASVLRLPREKNMTDTEAAIGFALESGADDIVLLGATGRRFDHAMGNIAMLVRAARAGVRCRILDAYNEMWAATGDHSFSGRVGQTLSIIPLTGDLTVSAQNLKYPLAGLALRADASRGISNVVAGSPVRLSISGGYALIVKVRA